MVHPGRAVQLLVSMLLTAMLAACGGGGGDDGPSPSPVPPANAAPVFSSPSTASVPEGTQGIFYTAVAADPEGRPVTYALAGGADQAI